MAPSSVTFAARDMVFSIEPVREFTRLHMTTATLSIPTDSQPEAEAGLRIGDRCLPSRYFLAPLAGYTQLAFRRAIRAIGGIGLATTDLVLAGYLVRGTPKSRRLVKTHPDDKPLSVQIFGKRPDDLVAGAMWLEDHGYGGVDINMGCPMGKVNAAGGGAKLMCDADAAAVMVARVVEAVAIPVTVKMRLGWDRDSITSPELARAFERVGVAAITIHGRTRQQGFSGSVNRRAIRDTVDAVDAIPVIGNGDVRSVDDAITMRDETGCDAVAIGRGAMLDPWIFRKLQQVEAGDEPTEPSRDEQLAFLTSHFAMMADEHGEYACVLFRKFAGWYGARMGIPEDLEDRMRRIESTAEFDDLVEQIARRQGERESKVATALVKVPNGPVERW